MKRITLSVGALALAAMSALPASASADATITVPKAGPAKASASWTGTYPLGTNVVGGNSSGCNGDPSLFNDSRTIQVSVPAGAYDLVKAKMAVTVDSHATLNGDFLEVLDPAGNSAGVDQQKAEMEVDVTNPVPGTWTVLTCMFVPDTAAAHSYQGTVTITTKCRHASPCQLGTRKHR